MRYLALVAILFVGCGDSDSDNWGSTASTPDRAVKAFIAGAVKKDVKALGKMFSSNCEREFKKIVDGSVSDKDMDGLAKMFKGATITGATTKVAAGTASVEVKLPGHPRGKETLNLVKEGDAWKIVGF